MNNLHIGIIPDGNRRYAIKNNISKIDAYRKGYKLIINLIKYLIKNNNDELYEFNKTYNINIITIYVCSIDNLLKRDANDVSNIYKLIFKFIRFVEKNIDYLMKYKIRIHIIGNLSIIKKKYRQKLEDIMARTKDNDLATLNLAIAYSGRYEIVNNIKKIGNTNITEEDFSKLFDLQTDIDIVIRTGNECRTSNFFPYNTIYSEWFFLEKMWPELSIDDIVNIIREYKNRNRRFGK